MNLLALKKSFFQPKVKAFFVLTESGQLESVRRADQIDERLQLETTSCYIQIVI